MSAILAWGAGTRADIAKLLEDGQLFFPSDPWRFVELATSLEKVRDSTLGDRERVDVPELFEDRQHFVGSDSECLVETKLVFATGLFGVHPAGVPWSRREARRVAARG